jgi:hypothetical protein
LSSKENAVPEIALPPPVGEVRGEPSPTMDKLCARATVAGDHPLLRHLRSGSASGEEVLAWLQCRWCLADHLAKKEVLVLAKAKDREGRRLWVQRVLALDGYGDFYGSSKQGLIEHWKGLCALVPSINKVPPPSAELIARLKPHFERHLRQVQDASWIDSLCISLVDDWVVQNDLVTANLLSVAGASMGCFRSGRKPTISAAWSASTIAALDSALSALNGQSGLEPALVLVDARIELEHTILTAAQKFAFERAC